VKALYCQVCGDIIAPFREANRPRPCRCGRHHVWWVDPFTGILRIHDAERANAERWAPHAFVIGMTNAWLGHENEWLTREDYRAIIAQHRDTYLFKTLESVAIRIRPGTSNDTAWADALPEATT
jgi:hypothetical protein